MDRIIQAHHPSVAFGMGHIYQGAAGAVRAGLIGLVLTLAVVFSGSLLVAMLMHTVQDMVQGRLLHAAVNAKPRKTGPDVGGERSHTDGLAAGGA